MLQLRNQKNFLFIGGTNKIVMSGTKKGLIGLQEDRLPIFYRLARKKLLLRDRPNGIKLFHLLQSILKSVSCNRVILFQRLFVLLGKGKVIKTHLTQAIFSILSTFIRLLQRYLKLFYPFSSRI